MSHTRRTAGLALLAARSESSAYRDTTQTIRPARPMTLPIPIRASRGGRSCRKAARGDRRAPSRWTRTASQSGWPNAAAAHAHGNSCLDRATGKMSDLPSVLKFDSTGKLVKSFGAGMLIFPHGIHVDRDGNIWVTDGQDNAPGAARGAGRGRGEAPTGPIGPRPGATIGNQVFKFSPEGQGAAHARQGRRRRGARLLLSRPTTSSPRRTATSSCPKDTAPATTGS